MVKQFKGLTQKEVQERTTLGLVNSAVDSYSPSYLQIYFRNFFNVITIALFPLMIGLLYFGIYRDVAAFMLFIVVSAIINSVEEIRVKKKLEALRTKFQIEVEVIRDGKIQTIGSGEIVKGDLILAKEGEGIVADGEIVQAEFLQVDEAALTGESDYIPREAGQEVRSGSFVITGKCIYEAQKVGSENYFNQLGAQSTKYSEHKSGLEATMQKFIYFFTAVSILLIALHFFATRNNPYFEYPFERILLSLTTIVATTIPQTLLIILILTFVISITKLARKGILVQKRGAIDDMSRTDVICMDKTGTITTNEMKIAEDLYLNIKDNVIARLFDLVNGRLYGENKTLITIQNHFRAIESGFSMSESLETFDQIPFNSQNKYSAFQIEGDSILMGAFSRIRNYITDEKIINKIEGWLEVQQEKGRRVVVGLYFDNEIIEPLLNNKTISTNKIFAVSIKEELNPGIRGILKSLKDQKIDVKVISGDSLSYVSKIAKNVGLKGDRAVDMSEFQGNLEDIIDETVVFARATPEDKLRIVRLLQSKGKKVAMIGDGINDVLGLKQSDVGIAMETGSKIAREISDIVLLKNDYRKIPDIFFEGNNIIFNLKITTIMFLTRTFYFAYFAGFFSLIGFVIPIMPTTTLLFSFIGSSLGGYILMFARQDNISNRLSFFRDTFISAIPASIVVVSGLLLMYYFAVDRAMTAGQLNTAIALAILCISIAYTLILFIQAGKIRLNPFLFILIVAFGLIFGSWQTLLPIWHLDTFEQRIIVISVVYIGALLFIWFQRFVGKQTNNPKIVKSSFITGGAFTVVALLYPWRDYFAVEPVPIEHYDLIIYSITLTVGLLILVYKFLIPYLREIVD